MQRTEPTQSFSVRAHSQPATPWLEIVIIFLSSRLLIAIVAWLGQKILAKGEFYSPSENLLHAFLQWDANWFIGIAEADYSYTPGQQSAIAFFPLFPLLIKTASYVLPSYAAASFAVSNAAFFGSLVFLWKLLVAWSPGTDEGARATDAIVSLRLLAWGPVSFFFSTAYSESLFLFFCATSLYAAHRQRFLLAGVCGYFAALTRNAGVLLVAPLILEYCGARLTRPWIRPNISWLRLWPCLLPIAGFLTWGCYLGWRFGDPFLVVKVQASWDRALTWPWFSFSEISLQRFPPFHRYWFLGHAWAALILLGALFAAKIRPSLVVFGTLLLLLNLSATHLESIPRLVSVIFPLYLGAAVWLRRYPIFATPMVALSAALLALATLLFTNGYWFT